MDVIGLAGTAPAILFQHVKRSGQPPAVAELFHPSRTHLVKEEVWAACGRDPDMVEGLVATLEGYVSERSSASQQSRRRVREIVLWLKTMNEEVQ